MTQPPPGGPTPDPRRRLNRIRNIIIGVIVVVTIFALLGACGTRALRGDGLGGSARDHITQNYQRETALDDGDVDAYIADGTPAEVADELRDAERPADQRGGAAGAGNVAGTQFLQYPDYLVGLFPYAAGQTRVMLSRDYRSGYNHYHSYVGAFWVPTPRYSGSGSGNRGGGSGGGGK
ncbi:DUF4247 domain-containing protein [Gordonia sp. zg691]|uniref:DUF4247 domain-containing protein n=1 Tax=Gordonia jinghuaiqii TaxID=2758710 RepID=A0A7D7QIC7_9ACTN|nr:DUF4247 domain-containing protein [Gordonia jinghuaiqii]MBD0861601.1 DUF4247 domain-containing protein [Gordonia jinghuaiqii]MCR5977473.1 DUF4247 domain-containing protein [Gordonia jinghuaiqii]QMT02164.1 DUF4247 domain-containing protein [Gordonia jinghuaiqii]